MGPSTHEAWFAGANFFLAPCQNACNAVGFCYKGRVAHGRGKPHQETLEVARSDCGLSNESERAYITKEDPRKYYVAQLPARGFDDGGIPVQCKDKGNKHGDQDAQAREDHCYNGLYVTPLQILYRDRLAAYRIEKRERERKEMIG